MKRILIINFLLLISSSSFCQSSNKSSLVVFDMAKQYEKPQEAPLSKFASSVSYIPLETNQKTIFGGLIDYEVNDRYIIVRHHRQGPSGILLFNRNSGIFIRKIGKEGRGPGEYIYHCYIPFNKRINAIYAGDISRNLLVYDSLGNYKERIDVYRLLELGGISAAERSITFERTLNDTIFVGAFVDGFGIEKNKVALLTKDGLLKVFPNYQYLNSKTMVSGSTQRRFVDPFHNWNNNLYFYKTLSGDTVFQVTKDLLIPRYFFNWGKYNISRSEAAKIEPKELVKYFFVYDILENNKYVFVYVSFDVKIHLSYIDKSTNVLTFIKSQDNALENDLDGFMNFEPRYITQNNEMVCIFESVEILSWIEEHPDKAVKAMNRFPWLKNINEYSNPVIAIAKCK